MLTEFDVFCLEMLFQSLVTFEDSGLLFFTSRPTKNFVTPFEYQSKLQLKM